MQLKSLPLAVVVGERVVELLGRLQERVEEFGRIRDVRYVQVAASRVVPFIPVLQPVNKYASI